MLLTVGKCLQRNVVQVCREGPRCISKMKHSYGLILMPKNYFIEDLLLVFANVSLAQKRLQARVSQGLSKQSYKLHQSICEASFGKQGGNAISDAFFFNGHVNNKTALLKASPPFNALDNRHNRLEGSVKGGLQERAQGFCEKDVAARNDKDWESQSLSAVSMRELMKITELSFSGDMREGDSEEQVALLQGDETNVLKSGKFEAAEYLPLVGNDKDRLSQTRSQLSQKIKEFDVRKFSENFGIAVSTPNWKVTPERGGTILIICAILFVLLNLWISMKAKFQGHPVKRRILRSEWYTDTNSRANRAKTRATCEPAKGSKPLRFCSDFSLAPAMEDQSGGHGELVNCNGQVLCGSSSAVEEINGGNLIAFKNSVGQYRSKKKMSPAALLVVGDQSPYFDTNEYGSGSHQLQNGIEHDNDISQLSGPEERPWNEHGFLHWIKNVFSKFDLGSLVATSTCRHSKRRIVARNTIRRPARKVERSYERIKAQRSCIFKSTPLPASSRSTWQEKAEHKLKENIEELCKAVHTAEQNCQAALEALAEERQQRLELEAKIRRQRKAAAALEEEVRLLKESHDALLDSLRNKYSSSAAARAAAALLYQNWDTNHGKAAHGRCFY